DMSLLTSVTSFFFFKQKTAYEIGLGIPAEPLFRSRRAIMFMLVSWFGLTLPLLNAAGWFRGFRLLTRSAASSYLGEVISVWCSCCRDRFCSSSSRHLELVWRLETCRV